MHPPAAEYRTLTPRSDRLGDCPENHRKCALVEGLDDHVEDPTVAELLLEILREREEYDLARVEAVKVVGLFVAPHHPLHIELWSELKRIGQDPAEDEMIRGWAQRYLALTD